VSQGVKPAAVLVGGYELLPVHRGDGPRDAIRDLLKDDDPLSEIVANVLPALGAVGELSLEDAGSNRAFPIDQPRLVGQAAVTEDILGWDPEPEVLVPAIAQDPRVVRVRLDIGAIGQAKITPVSASREEWFHPRALPSEITILGRPGRRTSIPLSPLGRHRQRR
jgi:hypothetical protein